MDLAIQWFIFTLVSNELTTVDYCVDLYQSMDNPSLEDYAQRMLDLLASQMEEEVVDDLMNQMQAILDFASEQANGGMSPEIFVGTPFEIAGEVTAPDINNEAEEIVNTSVEIPPFDNILNQSDTELKKFMEFLLTTLRNYGASDLHISAMSKPFVRRNLQIERISEKVLTPEEAKRLNYSILNEEQKNIFEERQDYNFALEIGKNRFRVALMQHKDGVAGSYRIVPDHICSLAELGFLPNSVSTIERMLDYNNGLVLVTGPIGGGKTTTLGAMIDILNTKREDHIITVEDPIEILQLSKNCQVNQRQIGTHTKSYHSALKAALREDPDVIVIGEMHDLETIENAITASETGHLVIGTLHTSDAGSTLNRILDVFPSTQQPQIRAMVAGSLRGIICQRLIPGSDGNLTLAYEIMTNTSSISSLIGDGKTHQLKQTMQIGSKSGMCTLDQCLLDKFKLGAITYETALSLMTDPSIITQTKQHFAMLEARKLASE